MPAPGSRSWSAAGRSSARCYDAATLSVSAGTPPLTSFQIRAENARTVMLRFGWVACALLLALGSAGIVTGMQHQPGTGDEAAS